MSQQITKEEIKKKTRKYVKLSLHYSDNAQKFLKLEEFEKASEMMWGSMSTILKAVASSKGEMLNKHGYFYGFAKKLAKEMDDPEVFTCFLLASNLHINFYESNLKQENTLEMIKKIARMIGKLMRNLGYRPR